ncbi:MAG: hypothetical protein HRT61_20505 [Ekhidna sp.]|nr:hypothetical protein [Ekhidna sp.]
MKTHLQQKILRASLAMLTLSILFTFSSCGDDDEPQKVFERPTISISAPSDLSNLEALVASPFVFTIDVSAEAGLSSVTLNGDNIKTYSGDESEDSFEHEFIPTEEGTLTLEFGVEDAQGELGDAATVTLNAVGDFGFLLADFAGSAGNSVALSSIDPEHWDADRTITTFDVNNNLEPTTATFENMNNQFTISVGSDNPDPNAALEFSGKVMKVEKNPAPWGAAGWSHIMFDFGTTLDQSMIEALPRMNDSQDGLTAGTKYIEVDVYYQDSEALAFSDMTGEDVAVGDNPAFGSDKAKGYSFFLMVTNHDTHRLNPDGAGMYIGYREYLTEANKWVTLRFDDFYTENAGNNFGSENEDAAGSYQINGIKIIAGGGYGDGQSENAIYFKNLRIVDAE